MNINLIQIVQRLRKKLDFILFVARPLKLICDPNSSDSVMLEAEGDSYMQNPLRIIYLGHITLLNCNWAHAFLKFK